jgi:hypothetical protein
MRNTTRQTRKNRTITVDFRDEATYFQLLGDGKAFLECILAFVMALGFQLKHKATCSGGGWLIAVRQDEGPAAAPLDQEGKDNGFARPCRQYQQGPVDPTRRGGEQGRDRFILVRPRREPECGRRLGNSLHLVCSQANDDGHRHAMRQGTLGPRAMGATGS